MKTVQGAGLGSFALALLVALPAWAEDFYVATTGSDADATAGTINDPFATIERAQTAASPNDTVFIRGGTYRPTELIGVNFTKDGLDGQPINYFAMPGEVPVIDMSQVTPTNRVTGLGINADWLHIRGLEVTGVRQFVAEQDSWGVRIQASNNILENLNVHDNEAPGVFITSGTNNLILNCDSHDNFDVLEQGGSGDGFGCHSPGGGNVMRGCRAYENSDDGFDFIDANATCTVEYSWAFRNGYEPGTTNPATSSGTGFKVGGYGGDDPADAGFPGVIPRHVARFNVAFNNRSQGFYANHHPGPGGIDFFNNTAFNNLGDNFDMLAPPLFPATNVLRNNIATGTGGTIDRRTDLDDDANNSWTLPVTVSAADFLSQATDEALTPRNADGSLPDVSFLHLALDSDLIDQGIDIGLPFAGTAPDLGAFEVGLAQTPAPTDPGNGAGGAPSIPPGTGTAGAGGSSPDVGAGGTATGGGNAQAGSGTIPSAGGAIGAGEGQVPTAAGGAADGTGTPAVPSAVPGGVVGPLDEPGGDNAGCACRVPVRRSSAPTAVLLLLAGLTTIVYRRRR